MGDSESDSGEDDNNYALRSTKASPRTILKRFRHNDLEEGLENDDTNSANKVDMFKPGQEEEEITKPEIPQPGPLTSGDSKKNSRVTSFNLPKVASAMASISNLEQSMPADAVLAKAGAAEVSKSLHYAKDWLIEPFFNSFCKVSIQLLCPWESLPWKMSLKVVIYYLELVHSIQR